MILVYQSNLSGKKIMTKIVKGIVDADANIQSGEGFTVRTWGGSGIYVIEYVDPFREPPVVISTVAGPEWETFNLSTSTIDNWEAGSVICTSGPDRPIRSAFHFIAMGEGY